MLPTDSPLSSRTWQAALVRYTRRGPDARGLSRGKGDSPALGTRRILPQLRNPIPRVPCGDALPQALRFAQGAVPQRGGAQGGAEALRVGGLLPAPPRARAWAHAAEAVTPRRP